MDRHDEDEMNEQELLEALATNVDGHFDVVVTRYSSVLLKYAWSLTESSEDARDLLQDTFVRALKAMRGYAFTPQRIRTLQLHAWLRKIAYHAYLNTRRGRPLLPSLSLHPSEDSALISLEDENWRNWPEIAAIDEEARSKIEILITKLPESCRDSTRLRILEELGYEEVAQLLHKPVTTIRTEVHRGRKILIQMLSEENREGA